MSRNEVKKLINLIVKNGNGAYRFSSHAKEELRNDGLTTQDALNVLLTTDCTVMEGEFEKLSWRYRVRTKNITVVVAFDTATEMAVVSAWRNSK